MRITLVNLQKAALDEGLVQLVARQAATDAGAAGGAVTIALVDDAHIAALNRVHRHREGPTDVLAYEGEAGDPGDLGDVVVSVETAARQAAAAGRALPHEVAWLAAHGVLHLLGYNDAAAEPRSEMIARQDRALAAGLAVRESHRL